MKSKEEVQAIIAKGGHTIWRDGITRDHGFVVGGYDEEVFVPADDHELFKKVFTRYNNIMLMMEDWDTSIMGVGVWHDKGNLVLDLVQWHEYKEDAITEGNLLSQDAIYDLDFDEVINL
tara:strand:+ start:766 stop:1122 length:357 start_codon:yes stop_codon:yes gene_type:complete